MDSLKSLMDKREYELVLKLTESSKDSNSLIYRISAFISLGRPQAGLDCLLANRKTLESNLPLLIHVHFELLFILNRFDDAYEEVNYYSNLPYVSQEVEEILRGLPKLVRGEEKRAIGSKHMSDEDIANQLMSKDQTDVIAALDLIRDRDINRFVPNIEKLLVSYPKQSIRSFALLLLVQKQINKDVKFNHMDEEIIVNPTKLIPPFIGEKFNSFAKKLDNEFKDPVLSQNAVQLLSSYIIYIYPDTIPFKDEVTVEALFQISSSYMQITPKDSLEQRCLIKGLKVTEVEDAIHLIKEAVEDF